MIATDGSELVQKSVDSAIEIVKLSEAQLCAIYVTTLGELFDNPTYRCRMGKNSERASQARRSGNDNLYRKR
jgi:hypothetical protein